MRQTGERGRRHHGNPKKKENEKAGYIRRIQPALMEPKSKRSKITEQVVYAVYNLQNTKTRKG